jgi:hypothetical protein
MLPDTDRRKETAMKTAGLALLVILCTAGISTAQAAGGAMPPMPGMPGMPGMPMGPAEMAAILGPDLMAVCHGDLGELGLSPETRKAIEDKRFELQKKVIRTVADLRVLRLELARLLEVKGFDLAAAQQKAEEITAKEGEMRTVHLGFLSDVRAALTDEEWQKLRKAGVPPGGMPPPGMSGMMPMKGGPGPCPHGADAQPPKPDEAGGRPAQ